MTTLMIAASFVAYPRSEGARMPTLAEALALTRADGLTSDPAAVSWGAGRIDVFARGPDNALWHKWYESQWSGWESLGGSLASGPDVASWAPGRLDVFVRGTDNTLQHKWYENQWSGWESLGGGLTSDPSAVSWGLGRLDVFARGGNNGLWHIWYANGWSAWESLGGELASGPDASSWGKGRIDVFARGASDNSLQHKWYEGQWSEWESLKGGLTSDPSAVSSIGSGRIDVFARGGDNALWHIGYANGWSGWESLGGVLSTGPDASSWGKGRLDVFAAGTDNILYHRSYTGGWSAWEGLGAPAVTLATAQYSATSIGGTTLTKSTALGTSDVTLVPTTSGPAPTGLAVTGAGVTGNVSWQPAVGASSYVVTRWLQSDPSCCKASSPTLSLTGWTDTGLQWPGTYVYRVAVTYSDGKVGSADVVFTRPTPQDPTGFTATQTGEGQVKLTWQPVTAATTYLVGGPSAGSSGTTVTGTSVTLNGIPIGPQQWTVASLYSPGGLLTPGANWPKASLVVGRPSNVTVAVYRGKTTVDLTWVGTSAATVIALMKATAPTGPFVLTANLEVVKNSWARTYAGTVGATQYFKLLAGYPIGTLESDILTVTIPPPPQGITYLTAKASVPQNSSYGTAQLAWVCDPEAIGYRFLRGKGSEPMDWIRPPGSAIPLTVTQCSYTDTGLTIGATYRYTVSASYPDRNTSANASVSVAVLP